MNTLFKIVAFVLALAVIPVILFSPFITIVVTSKAASLLGGSEIVLDETYSFHDLYDTFLKDKDGKKPLDIKAMLEGIPDTAKGKLGPSFIAFLVFLVLSVLISPILAVLAIFCKNRRRISLVAGLGLLFTILMNLAFKRFATPLISGVVPVLDLLPTELLAQFMGERTAVLGGLLGSLLKGTSLVQVYSLSLSFAYVFMLLLYLASTIWAFTYSMKNSR